MIMLPVHHAHAASLVWAVQAFGVSRRPFLLGFRGALSLQAHTYTFLFTKVLPSPALRCSCVTLWASVQF